MKNENLRPLPDRVNDFLERYVIKSACQLLIGKKVLATSMAWLGSTTSCTYRHHVSCIPLKTKSSNQSTSARMPLPPALPSVQRMVFSGLSARKISCPSMAKLGLGSNSSLHLVFCILNF